MRKLLLIMVALLIVTAGAFSVEVPEENKAFKRSLGDFYDWLGPRLGVDDVDDVWYVNGDISTSAGGTSFSKAVKTINEALSLAGDDDVIVVAPGTYAEALAISENNLKLIGLQPTGGESKGPVILSGNASMATDSAVITITGDNVVIDGFSISVSAKDSVNGIELGTTAAINYPYIRNCYVGGSDSLRYGILFTADNVDHGLVEDCTFDDLLVAGVQLIGDNCVVQNNKFIVRASAIGLEYTSTTTTNVDNVMRDNVFLGANSSDTGIKITNSPGAGLYVMAGNWVLNCATTITGKTTNDAVHVLNYTGSAAGGALIDPSP